MPPATAQYRLGAMLALLAALGFSLKAIFVKLAYAHGVGATALLTIRFVFALPVFLIVAVYTGSGAPRLQRREWLMLLFLGLAGYYGAAILDFIGLRYISAGLERLILFTSPTLTVIIGVIFLGQRFGRAELVALLLTNAGIGLAFAHDLVQSSDGRSVAIGAGCVFLASLCFAVYFSGSAALITQLGSARFTSLAMLVSTTAVLIHHTVSEPLPVLFRQPWQVYALTGAMAAVSTVLPVFAQSAAIRRLDAGRAALVGTLGPMLTIFFAWWWLKEPISISQLAGMALVVGGVAVIATRRS